MHGTFVEGAVGRTRRRRCALLFTVVGLLVPLFVFPHTSDAASVYYVDAAKGSDSNPGTSTQPWRTIQKAANTMLAGDTCRVRAGNYPERVRVSRSGSAGAPLTFQAEGTVTMRGFTIRASYVTVRGFDISDTDASWTEGVGIYVEGSNCLLENNYVHYCTTGGIFVASGLQNTVRANRAYRNGHLGIRIDGQNSLVESNEVWGTIQHHPKWLPLPSYADADGIRFFGSGHVIRKNNIHDISYDDPLNVTPHIDCFQTFGSNAARNVTIEQNFCEVLTSQSPAETGHGFMLEDSYGLVIRNNIIQASGHVHTPGGNSNLTIVNNTFTSDLDFPLSNYPAGIILIDCPNSTVRNNIFYEMPAHVVSVRGTSTQGASIGNNLAYRSDGEPLWGSPFPGDLWAVNPRFVNAAANDFHLQSSSPAINAGATLSALVSNDYAGTARPQGAAYDMGAFEYTGAAQPTATPQPGPTSTPVPTNTPVPQPSSTPTSSTDFVVDDGDARFTTTAVQDTWQTHAETGGQNYGSSHRYNSNIGQGQDIATWSFQVTQAGRYQVYAWWYEGEWRPADVPYLVRHHLGSSTVRMNQQINGGRWNLLGTYEFAGSGSVTISDAASSGQDIVADAVRIVYAGPPSTGAEWRIYLPLVSH